ncbi:efflux RND transporter periplasmic adaptor subunit [Paracoccus sp. p4-l81]|uniref:efflux RND transporter periplasmic adaptor subunit n=1 Tax=unclassified Paracoccus (in: a-proteobacteria) TaxID=2688777 RepID=UPI0035B7D2FC
MSRFPRLSRVALALIAALVLPALPAAADDRPLMVEIVPVTASPVSHAFAITGDIAARDSLRIAFPSGGRLVALDVAEGATVRAGDLLGRIDAVQAEQNQRAARAGLTGAEAEARQARDEAARQDRLLAEGASTRARRDSARAVAEAAEAAAAAARAALDRADKAVADTELRAPADAVITARLAEPGQVVGPAQPVLELATAAGFDAIFDIPEAMLARPHELSPDIWMTLIDINAPPFPGRAREVSPRIDPQRGTVRVRVSIAGSPPGVSLGAAVRGTVTVTDGDRMTLPGWALAARDGAPAVWVVDPASMTVSIRPVTLLRHDTTGIVIADGLSPGEWVVGRGAHLLYPGRKVERSGGQP